MKQAVISEVLRQMLPYLDNRQLHQLRDTLEHILWDKTVSVAEGAVEAELPNEEILQMFLAAKKIEGCSYRTLAYYKNTLENVFSALPKSVFQLRTEDLRQYLADYQKLRQCSKRSLDNIRRILSSFFAWLEEENLILKSPMRRIHKIRTEQMVKTTFTDEDLEQLRNHCHNLRDLAIIDLLASTGMRVGELVCLNRQDIDFERRECIVFGKGQKERLVYFDARTKLHLLNYLASRKDNNVALFVSQLQPHNRLAISGVEIFLRKLGQRIGLEHVHPHKFRRTLATQAIDKGMPIEQVQCLLGHSKIDTTLEYAMVDQQNVKLSHKRYIAR